MNDDEQKELLPEEIGMPPVEDRIATVTIVWAKDGDILCSYPEDLWLAMRIMSRGIDAIAEKAKEIEALKAKEPSRIIMPAQFDPRFLRRKG